EKRSQLAFALRELHISGTQQLPAEVIFDPEAALRDFAETLHEDALAGALPQQAQHSGAQACDINSVAASSSQSTTGIDFAASHKRVTISSEIAPVTSSRMMPASSASARSARFSAPWLVENENSPPAASSIVRNPTVRIEWSELK